MKHQFIRAAVFVMACVLIQTVSAQQSAAIQKQIAEIRAKWEQYKAYFGAEKPAGGFTDSAYQQENRVNGAAYLASFDNTADSLKGGGLFGFADTGIPQSAGTGTQSADSGTAHGMITPVAQSAPPAPSAVSATPGNCSITLTWNAVQGATVYEIWYATVPYLDAAQKLNEVQKPSAAIPGLVGGMPYYFWVKAKNNAGTSGFSPMASGSPQASASPSELPAPVSVSATSKNGSIILSWGEVKGAVSYEVWYANVPYLENARKLNEVQKPSATISGLISDKTYYFWVKAKNKAGTSGFSAMADETLQVAKPIQPIPVPEQQKPQQPTQPTQPVTPPQNAASVAMRGTLGYPTLEAAVQAASGTKSAPDLITLLADIPITATIPLSGKHIKLIVQAEKGKKELERKLTRQGNFTGAFFTVDKSASLTLEGGKQGDNVAYLLLDGGAVWSSNLVSERKNNGKKASSAIVQVSGGSFTMNANAVLWNNCTTGAGGAVYLNGGELVINGGAHRAIMSNEAASGGGGVYAAGGASVTVTGGNISANLVTGDGKNGGGVYMDGGTFTLSGGDIEYNETMSGAGAGVFLANKASFVMKGGNISNNVADSTGGGISITGGSTITMSGGGVTGNKVTGDHKTCLGGGVYMDGGTFTMTGGSVISNETGKITRLKSEGVRYFPNLGYYSRSDATGLNTDIPTSLGNGGGVYIDNGGILTVVSGERAIYNNVAVDGGGVYIAGNGTFAMQGGVVYHNVANGDGGGVYIKAGTFTKTGDSVIFGPDMKTPYGSLLLPQNTAKSGNGHAVFAASINKKRDNTAGKGVNLSTANPSLNWDTQQTAQQPQQPQQPDPKTPQAGADGWNIASLDTARNVSYLSDIEKDVILEMNKARSNPKKYAEQYIQPKAASYRGQEGNKAVVDCVNAMTKTAGVQAFQPELGLSRAAKDHTADQGKTGQTGHYGADKKSPFDRMKRYGQGYSTAGENVAYGTNGAREIIIELLIDDGVPDRGHRLNILSKDFTQTGVSIGTHPSYRIMCVIDFARGYKSN